MSKLEVFNNDFGSIDDDIKRYQISRVHFRVEKRELWSKVIVLSSAILGFSITMISSDFTSISSASYLQTSWATFLVNIALGLFLLKSESDFESAQSTAQVLRKWDESEISIPVKTQEDKNKMLALIYLHDLRVTPKKELPFSKYAIDIFEGNKNNLTSWKMIKNPEKFYSYLDKRTVDSTTTLFYGSFMAALLMLFMAVVLM